MKSEVETQLKAPFPASEIEWRAGSTDNKENPTRAMALAYLTARSVMDRLDEVFGVDGWADSYEPGPAGGVLCRLSVREPGMSDWVAKEDVAENTDMEAIKGGVSDAFKRAAVKFGVGRYLYRLDSPWVPCHKRGRSVVLSKFPELPEWARPAGDKTTSQVTHDSPGAPEDASPAPEPAPPVKYGVDFNALKARAKKAGVKGAELTAVVGYVMDGSSLDQEAAMFLRRLADWWQEQGLVPETDIIETIIDEAKKARKEEAA